MCGESWPAGGGGWCHNVFGDIGSMEMSTGSGKNWKLCSHVHSRGAYAGNIQNFAAPGSPI